MITIPYCNIAWRVNHGQEWKGSWYMRDIVAVACHILGTSVFLGEQFLRSILRQKRMSQLLTYLNYKECIWYAWIEKDLVME